MSSILDRAHISSSGPSFLYNDFSAYKLHKQIYFDATEDYHIVARDYFVKKESEAIGLELKTKGLTADALLLEPQGVASNTSNGERFTHGLLF